MCVGPQYLARAGILVGKKYTKNFLDKVVPDIKPDESIDDAYSDFEEERKKEIKDFSYEVGVPEDVIYKHISEYQFSGIIDNETMSDEIKAPLLKNEKY